MEETFLMMIEHTFQLDNEVLILPALSAEKFQFETTERIKIVKPDNQVLEMNAHFVIPFITPAQLIYEVILPNARKEEVPIGSQVWIKKTLEEITHKSE